MSATRSRVRMAQPLEYGAVMPDAHPVAVTEPVRRRRGARLTRWLGNFLIVAGVCVLGWTLLVWQWQDPFTALYTRWEQRELRASSPALVKEEAAKPPVVAAGAPPAVAGSPFAVPRALPRSLERRRTDRAARRAAARAGHGDGRRDRLGHAEEGPGRDGSTFMPGEGKLVYIAGHRTTYSAPFAHIDRLEPGDRIRLEMPYATSSTG